MCRYKNVGVAGYAEAFMPVQSDLQTSEWYSYFENDVLELPYCQKRESGDVVWVDCFVHSTGRKCSGI